jgi:hypothetical protein
MSRKENWEKRDIWSLGPKFRIDTNNPQMGSMGTNVYSLYAVTDEKNVNLCGFTESGNYRIWNDRTIEIIGGNKDSTDGVDIVMSGLNGDITITACRNGTVRIKGKNVVIEADEDIDLKAGRNINVNGKARVLLKGNQCEADGLLGNLIPDSFGALSFAKSFVGGDILSSTFLGGIPDVIGTSLDLAIGAKDALSGGPGSLIQGAANLATSALGSNNPISNLAEPVLHTMQSAKDLKDSIESIEGNKFSFELE